MRKIYGNWKMAQDRAGIKKFFAAFNAQNSPEIEIALFPSFVHLELVAREARSLRVGAQDCSRFPSGAHTGEISAQQIRDLGLDLILLGHSECRQGGDSEETLAQKLASAKAADLEVCYCIGESLSERESGQLWPRLEAQLATLKAAELPQFSLAYEPIWAIGTGRVAERSQIEEVVEGLSKRLPNTPLLYGGSVTAENAQEILEIPGLSGLLIGGASLKAESLDKMVHFAKLGIH
jgi:triosephosphate isomerase